MIIILSPSKKQRICESNDYSPLLFDEKKNQLVKILKNFSLNDIQTRFKTSDNLSKKTYSQYQKFNEISTVFKTYTGDAFKHLDMPSLNLDTLNRHVRILSALYGVLEPTNRISPYRLDFITKLDFDLYDFWKEDVTNYFNQLNKPIINLASNEFSKMIETSKLTVPMYHFKFLNTRSVKQTRGIFARSIIENECFELDKLDVDGFKFISFENNTYIYEFIK